MLLYMSKGIYNNLNLIFALNMKESLLLEAIYIKVVIEDCFYVNVEEVVGQVQCSAKGQLLDV